MAQPSHEGASGASGGAPYSGSHASAGRELILVASPAAALRASERGIASAVGADVDALASTLAAAGATIRPLFGETEERLQAIAANMAAAGALDVPDLSVYYRVEAPDE